MISARGGQRIFESQSPHTTYKFLIIQYSHILPPFPFSLRIKFV
uniref:Uncharacterized protein n=1 Tax=Aegilops tauschii subsp. strangulata TaxID=200361 RepID=A0A452Z292_AEGTS